MASSNWKQTERNVAKLIGGRRRGPVTRGHEGGRDDVIHSVFSIEIKTLQAACISQAIEALDQARRNRDTPMKIPVAVMKAPKHSRLANALVFGFSVDFGNPSWSVPMPKQWRKLNDLVDAGVLFFETTEPHYWLRVMRFKEFVQLYGA